MPATMHANSRAAGMCAACKSANTPRLKTPKTPHCATAGKPVPALGAFEAPGRFAMVGRQV